MSPSAKQSSFCGSDGKRKRAPIPVFVPREKRAAGEANGDKSKGNEVADAPEREAKLARTESNDKRSVFERLKSGSGKVSNFSHCLPCLKNASSALLADVSAS